MRRESTQELPVSQVHTLESETKGTSRETVACPQNGTVSIEQCRRCPRVLGFAQGADCTVQKVRCRVPIDDVEVRADTTIPLRRASVHELMSRNIVCVRATLTLDAVVALFVETGLKAVPVVDEESKVIGMLEESNVHQAILAGDATARAVGDIMLPMSFVIRESVSAAQAAGLMVYEGVQRVPVVSCDGQIIGILSASDIMYWLARADGYVLPSPRRIG